MQVSKKILTAFFSTLFLSVIYVDAFSQNNIKSWKIKKADNILIKIHENSVVRDKIPDEMFSFNINYISLQEQIWDTKKQAINPKVIKDLKVFSGSTFRFPGGIVANNVDWSGITGPLRERKPQKSLYNRKPVSIKFGIDEYLNLVETLNGKAWYVLNLMGKNALNPLGESVNSVVAIHNKKLAEYLKPKLGTTPHYYQLGNELDRAKYEWSPEKYVKRSRATIDAMFEVDEDAKFVAFLREFKWKYKKDSSRGVSEPFDLMKTVLDGLPRVTDFSLHQYYDGKRNDGKNLPVTFWVRKINKSIDDYKKIRNGESPSIWITEHARQKSSNRPGKDRTKFYVSNLGGAISTADYLIALMQIPEVKGAFIHGLNAGPWQMFDYSVNHRDLRPLPIFRVLSLLKDTREQIVLETFTASTNYSNYKGGYDVRAVGFRNDAKDNLSIWVVNRASKAQDVVIEYAPFRNQNVSLSHRYIGGKTGMDADTLNLKPVLKLGPETVLGKFSNSGQINIKLPPSSISNILIETKSVDHP